MKAVLVFWAGLTTVASYGVAAAQAPTLTPSWVQELEASLDLQAVLSETERELGGNPMPVAAYARYYRMAERDGTLVVEALYAPSIGPFPDHWRLRRITGRIDEDGRLILEDGDQIAERPEDLLRRYRRGIYINEPFPVIDDGGCSVVKLFIDYRTSRVLAGGCNGVA